MDFNTIENASVSEETLEKFVLVDAETLSEVLSQRSSATCVLDPVPTSFLNQLRVSSLQIYKTL